MTDLKNGDTSIDSSLINGYMAVIDSGTSLIAGSTEVINAWIDGIVVDETCTGVEDLPDLTIQIDSHDYVLTPDDYVLRITQGSNTQCLLGIAGMEVPTGFNYIIFGDVFMRPYPSYFNMNDNTVTFYSQ